MSRTDPHMFKKLKDLAHFAVVTRFGVGSRGSEVKRIYQRFENDPAVAAVEVTRRNLAMGIPGFVEGTIAARESLPDATLTSLALSLSDFLANVNTHAEVRPLVLTADGVSMAVGVDRTDVEKQIPHVLQARADTSLSSAEFSVKSEILHCIVVLPDAESNPETMEQTFVRWAELLPAGAVIALRNDSASALFTGTPMDIPLAMFRVWKVVAKELPVSAVQAAQLGFRPSIGSDPSPALRLTVTNESDIRAAYDLATDLLGPGAEVTVTDGRRAQLTTKSRPASTANILEETPAGVSDQITNIYVSPEGKRMIVSVSGEHRLVADELSQLALAEAFEIIIIELPDGHSYGSPAATLVAWADAFIEMARASTASKISLRHRHCTVDYDQVPSAFELRRAAGILHRVAPPDVTIVLRPGSGAPYRFAPSQPNPSSALQLQYKRAGDRFVKAWRALDG